MNVNIALLTVTDTRTFDNDKSGSILVERIKEANHNLIDRKICKDNKKDIVLILKKWIKSSNIDVVITTGGTGLTGRDITPEAVEEIADKHIPFQNTVDWSYPTWPSHLDHIIINHNLFDNLVNIYQDVKTIRIDSYLGSFQTYDNMISDHLPVGINLFSNTTIINENNIKLKKKNTFFNLLGQLSNPKSNTVFIKLYNDGTVEKKIIIE